MHDHVAARDVEVVVEHDGDRRVALGLIRSEPSSVTISLTRRRARTAKPSPVADGDRSGLDASEVAARRASPVGRATYCTGKRNGRRRRPGASASPGSRAASGRRTSRGARRDRRHVAVQRRQRDEAHAVDAVPLGERAERGDDRVERVLALADQVHLVDGDDEVRNAEQVRDRRVPARLLDDAVARVDQQDRELRGRRAP